MTINKQHYLYTDGDYKIVNLDTLLLNYIEKITSPQMMVSHNSDLSYYKDKIKNHIACYLLDCIEVGEIYRPDFDGVILQATLPVTSGLFDKCKEPLLHTIRLLETQLSDKPYKEQQMFHKKELNEANINFKNLKNSYNFLLGCSVIMSILIIFLLFFK